MIALLLEQGHFDVIQCEDAETAVLAIKRCHPSLVVTDIKLTGKMDGIELAHLAVNCDPAVRVLVISGQPPASLRPARCLTASSFSRSRFIHPSCCASWRRRSRGSERHARGSRNRLASRADQQES
nr:response regulator [Bradyrhizobium tropiciagri]